MYLSGYRFQDNNLDDIIIKKGKETLTIKRTENGGYEIENIGKYRFGCTSIKTYEEHSCGTQGFSQSPDDTCAGCEEEKYKEKIINYVNKKLTKEGIMYKDKI